MRKLFCLPGYSELNLLTLAQLSASLLVSLLTMPWNLAADQSRSPRLAKLCEQAAQGNTEAVDQFWDVVAEQGAPLIEPFGKNTEDVLVTFLFRGGEGVENVVVQINNGLWGDVESNRMQRIAGTDVWYRTYRFRKDARFTYALSVNDPLISLRRIQDTDAWVKRSATWRVDPLNPKQFPIYPRPVSVVELPDAPEQPWVAPRPGVAKGRVETQKIKSAVLGYERALWVYTPPDYTTRAKRYGILILFDGPAYNGWVPTPTILDNLIAEKKIPPVVAVLVSHPDPPTRNRELTCSEPFTKFLAEELMAWLRESFHVAEDPGMVVLGGSSNGGLGAAFAAFRHPEIFGNVLSQSGAFMYSPPEDKEPEWMIRQFASAPLLPIRFYLDFGLMEDQASYGVTPTIPEANRHFRDVLRKKGYRVHFQEFNGGHEYLNWRGTLADGLIALLGN